MALLLPPVHSSEFMTLERLSRDPLTCNNNDRLPNEMLMEIFRCACSSERFGDDADVRDVSLFYPSGRRALRLSLVCQSWRKVATSMPKLWSYINVSIRNHGDLIQGPLTFDQSSSGDITDDMNAYLAAHPMEDLVNLYLSQSSGQPLVIDVRCPNLDQKCKRLSNDDFLCDRLLSSALRVLSQPSTTPRWRIARINLPHGGELELWPRNHPPLPAPLLEVLHVYQTYTFFPFTSALRLHSLGLTGTSLFTPPVPNFSGLRVLTLANYRYSAITRILPKLGPHVEVTITNPVPVPDQLNANTCETSVEVLRVCLDKSEFYCSLFQNLIARNLTELELVDTVEKLALDTGRLLPSFEIARMLRNSSPPLKSLALDGLGVGADDVLTILEASPASLTRFTLTELDSGGYDDDDEGGGDGVGADGDDDTGECELKLESLCLETPFTAQERDGGDSSSRSGSTGGSGGGGNGSGGRSDGDADDHDDDDSECDFTPFTAHLFQSLTVGWEARRPLLPSLTDLVLSFSLGSSDSLEAHHVLDMLRSRAQLSLEPALASVSRLRSVDLAIMGPEPGMEDLLEEWPWEEFEDLFWEMEEAGIKVQRSWPKGIKLHQ